MRASPGTGSPSPRPPVAAEMARVAEAAERQRTRVAVRRLTETAQGIADDYHRMPKGPGAAGAFRIGERVFVGVSGPPVDDELHPRVIDALQAVPEKLRPSWHGACAEPKALTAALDDGFELSGGTMVTVRIARNGKHGDILPPCSACAHVLDQFEVRAVDG